MRNGIKIAVEGLAIGMYVSRLDRPWLETSFKVQGVEIESRDDIEEMRKYCNHVYVDVDKGISPDPRYHLDVESADMVLQPRADAGKGEPQNTGEKNTVFIARNSRYDITASFESELDKARFIYTNLQNAYERLVSDLKAGNGLDITHTRQAISAMTKSIIRNPAAMMWVISFRKINDNNYTRPLGNCAWCASFGRHLGLDPMAIENLALGGLLLDIGKVRQPDNLLLKTGQLNDQDRRQMNMHVYLGVKILEESLKKSPGLSMPVDVINMIATHHERADGSGYPQGLMNDDIPLYGRIAGIIDSYDAMTSQSPHINGEPMTPSEAISELYEMRGTKYQDELIEQFIQAVGLYPTGSLVELNTGEVGAVVAVNGLRRLRPSLVLLLDKSKRALLRYAPMDLSQSNPGISVSRGLAFGAFGIDMNELFE